MNRPVYKSRCWNPGCSRSYFRGHGDGLYCSASCAAQHKTLLAAAEKALAEEGFKAHIDIKNLYGKNGVYISIEDVVSRGIEKVLAEHARIPAVA